MNDYIASLNGVISNGCSIIEAVGVENVKIADLVVEGNKNTNDYINGCRGGGVYIHKSKNCLVENVPVNEFNGDSFSWQIDENITVRGCEASNGNGLGFHPGTGSDRSMVENCISHNNKGMAYFFAGGCRTDLQKQCRLMPTGITAFQSVIRIRIIFLKITMCMKMAIQGVLFRDETEQNSGHRNTFTNNTIENNGIAGEASGFYIGGETHDITITNNIIRSTGKGNQTTAILIGKKSSKYNSGK